MFLIMAIVASMLAHSIDAHMFISSPSPIPGTAPKPPLDASGSDFPCHGVTLPTDGGQVMAAGSQQTLAWDLGDGVNTAVHGGGSCQISITYETDSAKQKDPSNWKVIYSIEGGCPSDAFGNLGNSVLCNGSNGPNCVNSFPFTIPKGVEDGHAIMAWTWFNTIGNREMYMNCVNTQFTGGDGSEMNDFPSMFVANLASANTCSTEEQVNLKFPNPGKYVTTKTAGNPYPLALPTGASCKADGGAASLTSSPADASSSPAYSSSAAAATSASSMASTSSALPSISLVVPTSSASASPVAPTSSASPSISPVAGTPSPSSGTCPQGQVSCSMLAELICIDTTHFGICDTDNCAIPQAVAPSTTCSAGAILKSRKRLLQEHRHHRRS